MTIALRPIPAVGAIPGDRLRDRFKTDRHAAPPRNVETGHSAMGEGGLVAPAGVTHHVHHIFGNIIAETAPSGQCANTFFPGHKLRRSRQNSRVSTARPLKPRIINELVPCTSSLSQTPIRLESIVAPAQ
jgi:hypothetical protein